MTFSFADAAETTRPLYLIEAEGAEAFLAGRPAAERTWLTASGFAGKLGQLCLLPGADGAPAGAAFGLGAASGRRRGRFHVARAVADLPAGAWHLEGALSPAEAEEAALGWLLATYRFTRYKPAEAPKARLRPPGGVDAARVLAIAEGEALTRDLINTPAADKGPAEREAAFVAL
ncbi:MAG: leucyl aminopeptidase family protein, partial [Rhodobacteraceae bacterium]|nr:leucyl aminopeptidase family protein [Paracoccaceae bacterium]